MKIILAALSLIFFTLTYAGTNQLPLLIQTNSQTIPVKVELATTPRKRAEGLMHRAHLAKDEGMLFVFPKETNLSFWMKNTLIPLDILFINKHFVIESIKTMKPCKKAPCKNYLSETQVLYALELNAHFAEKHNIIPGDKVKFSLPRDKNQKKSAT